jgi:hypothetical protein
MQNSNNLAEGFVANSSKKLPLIGLAILGFLPAFFMAFSILKYSVNFPFSDQWPLAVMFEKIYANTFTISDLFAQFHESRKFFPRLIFIGLARLTNWDVRYEMLFIFFLTCLISINIYWLSKITLKISCKQLILLFIIANLLIFSPAQYENWLWGIQIVVYLPILCLTSCILISHSKLSANIKLILTILLTTVATYSYANGMLNWLLVLPVLLVGITKPGQALTDQFHPAQYKKFILIWLIAFLFNIIFYFYQYTKPDDHPSFISGITQPINSLHYFLVFTGSSLAFGNLIVATIVGFIVTVAWLFIVFKLTRIILKKVSQPAISQVIGWLVIGLYGIISGLVTSLGRVGFGVSQALAPRYTAFSIYIIISLIYLVAIYLSKVNYEASLARKKYFNKQTIIGYFLLGIFCILQIQTYIFAMNRMADRRDILLQSKACLLMVNVVPKNSCLVTKRELEPFKNTANILDQMGYLQPGLVNTREIADIAENLQPNLMYGAFDQLEKIDAQNYRVTGWAILPHRQETADGIILTYEGVAENDEGEGMIFQLINQRIPRQEIAEKFGETAYNRAGWQHSFDRSQLPPGQWKINAWAFDTDTGKAYLLDNSYVINNN